MLKATGEAIRTAQTVVTTPGAERYAAITPAELTNISNTANAEITALPEGERAEWRTDFNTEMKELAAKPENAGVRGQIDAMLKKLGCAGLQPAAAAQNVGWKNTGGRGRAAGAGGVEAVSAPQLEEVKSGPSISGKLSFADGKGYITTDSGKRMEIVQASNSKIQPGMTSAWMSAFADDGPVTVRGTMGSDGKFLVDDYCPGTSNHFTHGRVDQASIEQGKVILKTAAGDVEVTNPELKEVFLRAPRLGVILPGNPKDAGGGKLVYDGNPQTYFALGGRANEVPDGPNKHSRYISKTDDGKLQTLGDMAYSFFSKKPIRMEDPATAARFDYPNVAPGSITPRAWLLGRMNLSEDKSTLESFDAVYAGKNPEVSTMGYQDGAATAVKPDVASSMLGAQGFSQAQRGGMDGFFWRNTPAHATQPQ